MTRVLLVHQPIDGGVGRHVADLAAGLTERGHQVITCGPSPPPGVPPECEHVELDLQRAVSPRADAQMLRRFSSIVRRVGPNVVHAHSSKAGAVARLGRLRNPRVPVIYTPHGYAFAGFFARELERRAYRNVERALARLANRVLCVCEAEARLARSVGPSDRVRVVYNGIEASRSGETNPQMTELAGHGPVLCTVTLLRPGKGLETLIDAAPNVLANQPLAQIAIWGAGPDLDRLSEMAAARGVGGAVHFLGATTDPLSVLRGATAFVLPSWAEAFPYAILEAMAVGLPIVASDVGGIAEALSDGQDGLLVPKDDPKALARALSHVLEDPDRASAMGRAARQTLEDRFSRSQMIDGVVRIYREISPL